ncbi:MAG: hypothetical protein M1539_04500 [Actinobacteria bacterium]|nr:hypothetical protein [Actinomycetota bacterium]
MKIAGRYALVLILALAVVIVTAIISGCNEADNTKSSATSVTQQNSVAQAQAKTKPQTVQKTYPHFNDGSYNVGTDIQPGTYRTRSGSGGGSGSNNECYYSRTDGANLGTGQGDYTHVVTILPTDTRFHSENCGTWTQDLSAITTSQTSFSDGTFIVGTDILPGTYKASDPSRCWWRRLSDFSNEKHGNIIESYGGALDKPMNPVTVTISATDKGFETGRCGTWTKK